MQPTRRVGGPPLLGILLLAAGVVLLLDNLQVWDFDLGDLIWHAWPLILIVLGLRHLLSRRLLSGAVLLIVGIAFQLMVLDLVSSATIRRWWPVLLIALGVWLVLRYARPEAPPEHARSSHVANEGDTFRVFQMLGGTRRVITSQSFRGGEATAFMGGVEVDLRPARLDGGAARIDVTAFMGGVELHVPSDWEVTVTGAPLLGAVEDKRGPLQPREDDTPHPRLEVRATVLMGGLEIA